jgi:uroporphyrinogen-III decarboxylase
MAALLAAIPSPSTNVVHLGPFTIHVYGLCRRLGPRIALQGNVDPAALVAP